MIPGEVPSSGASLGARHFPLSSGPEETLTTRLPYECEHCGERFVSRLQERAHVARAHPFSRLSKPPAVPVPDSPIPTFPGDRWSR